MSNKDDLDQLAYAFVPSWEDEADHHEVTVMKPLDMEVARKLSEQADDNAGNLAAAPAAPVVPPAPVTKVGFGSTMIMSSAPPVPTRAAQKEATFPTGEAPTAKNLAVLSETPNSAPIKAGPTMGLATMVDIVPAGALAGSKPKLPAAATMVSATGTPLVAKKQDAAMELKATESKGLPAAVPVTAPAPIPEAEPVVIVTGPVAVAPVPIAPMAPVVAAPAVEAFVSPIASPIAPRREAIVSPFSSPSIDDEIVLPKQPSKLKWVLLAAAVLGGGAAAFAATRTPGPAAPTRVAAATVPTDPPASPIPPPPAATKGSDLPTVAASPQASLATAPALPNTEHHAAATSPATVAAKVEPKVDPKKPEPPKVEPQKPVVAVKRPTPSTPPPPSLPTQKPAGKGKGVIVREVPF